MTGMLQASPEHQVDTDKPPYCEAGLRRLLVAIHHPAIRRDPFAPTLDDLFGPDLEAEIQTLSRRLASLSERDQSDPDVEEECRITMIEFIAIIDEMTDRNEVSQHRFWQTFFIGGPQPRRGKCVGIFVSAADETTPRIRVILFPPLRLWFVRLWQELSAAVAVAREKLRQAIREAARAIERFGRWGMDAVRLCLASVRSALTLFKLHASAVPIARDDGAILRDLIGELLTPHVRAPGGPGAFILRI